MIKKKFFKTKQECEVSFELTSEGAEQVELLCESNDWQPIEMKKARKDTFRTRIRLPSDGRYQFRYLVDRQSWINDEDADAYVPNHFGGEDGVLSTVREG
jgi:1,4-alpha-glucan branching enzyme